jgi:sn-glycerol 3-phosphate transport system ATP-binding protein
MRVEIRNLQRATKVTSLYVTHDQVEAMTLADRLVVMNGGIAEQIGTPSEVYSQPASRFVAEFIGSPSMNMLDGVAGEGGRMTLAGGSDLVGEAAAEAGRPILVGIRPEHLALANGHHPDLELKVEAIEMLGADTMAHGVVAGANGHAQKMVVRLSGGEAVSEGDLLPLRLEAGRSHLFDAQTGRRI